MHVDFEMFCSRPFDFVGCHVLFFLPGGRMEEEFLNSIDDVQDCIDSYRTEGCYEVYLIPQG